MSSCKAHPSPELLSAFDLLREYPPELQVWRTLHISHVLGACCQPEVHTSDQMPRECYRFHGSCKRGGTLLLIDQRLEQEQRVCVQDPVVSALLPSLASFE